MERVIYFKHVMNSKLSWALIGHIKTGYSISLCIKFHVFSINFHAIHLKSCHVHTYDFSEICWFIIFIKICHQLSSHGWKRKLLTFFFTNKNNHWFVSLKWNYKSYESKYGLKSQRLDLRKSSKTNVIYTISHKQSLGSNV